MRIISGRYRGKKLIPPPSESGIRPTTDRAKEALFNIMFDYIDSQCVFLDLFSGSGAIGIEALSRGAKKVYFVDSSGQAVTLIKKNLTGIQGNYEILNMNFEKALTLLKNRGESVNVVYADPPYAENLGEYILSQLQRAGVVAFGGIIAIERNKEYAQAESAAFPLVSSRKYALSCIDFYKREKRVAITGTFDPFTAGHQTLVDKAREVGFDAIYIVLLVNKDKAVRFSLEKRIEIINIALKDNKNNIIIDSYDGLTVDYCNKNDIQYILRGIRDSSDAEYERQMAEYNFKNGGILTILMPATSAVSSTLVRKNLDEKKDIARLVDENVIKLLKE
ncbi:MAG: 16S rRNA (guanine(966)-N(2))-methyltransferase RsmD [Clostridia bacterium]|nr:16S rRNA (guanine(966)-N(2))-methyltransferase RsmD [Clostridia bacterium]